MALHKLARDFVVCFAKLDVANILLQITGGIFLKRSQTENIEQPEAVLTVQQEDASEATQRLATGSSVHT